MSICKICQGEALKAVDEALTDGVTVRDVASQFGFSKSAVGRHRQACLQPRIAAAARIVAPAAEVRAEVDRARAIASGQAVATPSEVLSLTALLDRLARSLERLEGACDLASGDKLHAALAALSGQLHRGIEAAAKIQNFYHEPEAATGPRLSVVINLPQGLRPGEPLSLASETS